MKHPRWQSSISFLCFILPAQNTRKRFTILGLCCRYTTLYYSALSMIVSLPCSLTFYACACVCVSFAASLKSPWQKNCRHILNFLLITATPNIEMICVEINLGKDSKRQWLVFAALICCVWYRLEWMKMIKSIKYWKHCDYFNKFHFLLFVV